MNDRQRRRWSRVLSLGLVIGVLALSAGHAAAQTRLTAATVDGWPGGLAAYQGRYRLTFSSNAQLATSGSLTIFGRRVPHQAHMRMSGILALYTSTDTNVLYLTHFSTAGAHLLTRVNMGIYTGPVIATFAVQSHHGATLIATLTQIDGTTTRLTLVRFSTNPHP